MGKRMSYKGHIVTIENETRRRIYFWLNGNLYFLDVARKHLLKELSHV